MSLFVLESFSEYRYLVSSRGECFEIILEEPCELEPGMNIRLVPFQDHRGPGLFPFKMPVLYFLKAYPKI